MATRPHNPWLHRFAILTAAATLLLLGIGGLVTSKGAGLAVPDWPTSYGYNLFALPFKFWQGGALYEHSHRLVASGVGVLTMILAMWLWFTESRRWVRWLGVTAFATVVVQGILGGLRVVWLEDEIGIFHATVAQLFFALTCAIALFTSKWWKNLPSSLSPLPSGARACQGALTLRKLRGWALATTVLILGQLALGAMMRHQHAGLAIPDFPLAYGRFWPAMDADSVARYNQQRIEVEAARPITAFQIGLQMAHRLMALWILVAVGAVAWGGRHIGAPISGSARTETGFQRADQAIGTPLRRLAFFWFALIPVQIALGAWTVWSNKAADVATAHVLFGALSLVTGVLWCAICFRCPTNLIGSKSIPANALEVGINPSGTRAATATGN